MCQCLLTIKRPKGANAAIAHGVFIVKILNKCILSILVYILFLDRQRNILYTPQYVYTPGNQMLRFVGDQRFIKRVKRF